MSVWGIKFLFSFHFCLYSVLYIVELSKNSSSKTYILLFFRLLLLFSHSVVSDSLWPHGLQHTRLLCLSPSPGACSNSCPLSQWCHPTILSSVIPVSSCLLSFPTSGSFPISRLFLSGGQSIGASICNVLGSMSNPEIILKEDVHTQVGKPSFFEKGTVIINLYMKTLRLRDDTKEQMTLCS